MTPNSVTGSFAYEYKDSEWGDLLTNYRYISLTYDSLGNPLSYYNGSSYTFTWKNGRRLATAVKGSNSLSFEYNDDGIRTSKTVNGVVHTYYLHGSQILAESWEDKLLIYLYDASGSPIGFQYRNNSSYAQGDFASYWFVKNLQGDIVSVCSSSGDVLITYTYDAWGNFTTAYSNGGANTAAVYNPFKYRGYYHDSETGFYYLNSRYYDPATGRFLNADVFINANGGIVGFNTFAYCNNNFANRADFSGEDAIWLQDKNAVYGFGHTGLLIQDSDGEWYHFYWGNSGTGKSGKQNVKSGLNSMGDFEYENLTALNDTLHERRIYNGKYEAAVYFSGDFSSSLEYARKLSKNYSLFANNCMQVSAYALFLGKFDNYDLFYKQQLLICATTIIPNIAYNHILATQTTAMSTLVLEKTARFLLARSVYRYLPQPFKQCLPPPSPPYA